MLRKCSKCLKLKEESKEFYLRTDKFGYRSWCKECFKNNSKANREKKKIFDDIFIPPDGQLMIDNNGKIIEKKGIKNHKNYLDKKIYI